MSLGMTDPTDTPDEHGCYCEACDRTSMDGTDEVCPFCGTPYGDAE